MPLAAKIVRNFHRMVLGVAATCLLSSCAELKAPEPNPYLAETQPPPIQEFRWSNGGMPKSLDPARASAAPETDVVRAIYEGLTEVDPKTFEAVPAVAEKWFVSEDGKTWSFALREDAKWSNGRPVVANDFVRSWKRLLDLGELSAHRHLLDNFAVAAGTEHKNSEPEDFVEQEGTNELADDTLEQTPELSPADVARGVDGGQPRAVPARGGLDEQAQGLRGRPARDRAGDPGVRRLGLHLRPAGGEVVPRREALHDLRGHERDPADGDRPSARRGDRRAAAAPLLPRRRAAALARVRPRHVAPLEGRHGRAEVDPADAGAGAAGRHEGARAARARAAQVEPAAPPRVVPRIAAAARSRDHRATMNLVSSPLLRRLPAAAVQHGLNLEAPDRRRGGAVRARPGSRRDERESPRRYAGGARLLDVLPKDQVGDAEELEAVARAAAGEGNVRP